MRGVEGGEEESVLVLVIIVIDVGSWSVCVYVCNDPGPSVLVIKVACGLMAYYCIHVVLPQEVL